MSFRWSLLAWGLASFLPACSSSNGTTNGKLPLSDGGPSAGGSSNAGASGTGASAGNVSSGGSGIGGGGAACSTGPMTTPPGRPTGVSCPATATGFFPDAGAACNPDAGAGCSPGLTCIHGTCTLDACRTDGDCRTGFACICAGDFYGGNGVHGNVCVTAHCRVDADCGQSEVCSPSFGERCGGPTGVFCHSSADTCGTDADCCGSTPGCRYQSTLGHWACHSVTVCNG